MAESDISAIQARCDVLSASILEYLRGRGWRLAAAESLTGGLLADAFVRIPGASEVFLGSVVTYDIRAKATVLGVDAALLKREGAVHPEVARQMAAGAARLYIQSDHVPVVGLSTTGVAGPGPDGDKPAGLVYLGFSLPGTDDAAPCVEALELRLEGGREEVRRQTVLRSLENLMEFSELSQE